MRRTPAELAPQAIELRINELVLDGFQSADRQAIADALQGELAQLLRQQGIPASMTQDSVLSGFDAGRFDVAPNSRPRTIGAQVAQAVYRGITNSGSAVPSVTKTR